MALRARGENVYYYRSVRRGGRVTSEYLGADLTAILNHVEAERERDEARAFKKAGRAALAALVKRLGWVGRQAARVSARVDPPFRDAMTQLGYYQHRRQWRRRGAMVRPCVEGKEYEDARQAERARRLFEQADDVPALIERCGGGLARRVRERLIERVAQDAVAREALRRELAILRRELEGEAPTAVERLLVERVLAGWLAVHYYGLLVAGRTGDFENKDMAAHAARMHLSAERGYLAALRSLALVQGALAAASVRAGRAAAVARRAVGSGAADGAGISGGSPAAASR